MKQDLKFLAPVHFGDTITARAEVVEVLKEKNRIKLRTTCRKGSENPKIVTQHMLLYQNKNQKI